MSEFLMNYWRHILLGGIALFLVGDTLKKWVGSIKLPALSGLWPRKSKVTKNVENVEAKDIECIAHLRDRAVEYNDEVLLQEIKSVANKFFDIHSRPNTNGQ